MSVERILMIHLIRHAKLNDGDDFFCLLEKYEKLIRLLTLRDIGKYMYVDRLYIIIIKFISFWRRGIDSSKQKLDADECQE